MTTTVPGAAKVTSSTVDKAVTALLKWKEAQSKTRNAKLLPDDDFIYLIVTLKKIPPKSRTNPFKIPLPHPLHTPPSSELCLIIDDRSNSKPTKDEVKKLIKNQSFPVSKVITLSKLKASYKPFEAKRKLCDSYDLFLVDKRIVRFLPKLLGKEFFRKKMLPVTVDMTRKNWGMQAEKACRSGLLYMRTGTCCVVKVGKLSMENEHIVENVVEGIEGVAGIVPENCGGIRSLHLKLADSVALPLYQALPDLKLKIDGAKYDGELISGSVEEVKAESTDDEGLKGKEGKKNKKKKGRIHEVRYMDVRLGGVELDNENDKDDMVKNEEGVGQQSTGAEEVENVRTRRKKEDLKNEIENEGSDEESEGNGNVGSGGIESKKVKSGKPAKRGRKVGKMEGVEEKSSPKVKRKSKLEAAKPKEKRSKKRVAA